MAGRSVDCSVGTCWNVNEWKTIFFESTKKQHVFFLHQLIVRVGNWFAYQFYKLSLFILFFAHFKHHRRGQRNFRLFFCWVISFTHRGSWLSNGNFKIFWTEISQIRNKLELISVANRSNLTTCCWSLITSLAQLWRNDFDFASITLRGAFSWLTFTPGKSSGRSAGT